MAYLGPPSQPASATVGQPVSHFSEDSLPDSQSSQAYAFEPTQQEASQPSQQQQQPPCDPPEHTLPPSQRPWIILNRDHLDRLPLSADPHAPDQYLQLRRTPSQTLLAFGRYRGRPNFVPGSEGKWLNDVVFPDQEISNYHATIELVRGGDDGGTEEPPGAAGGRAVEWAGTGTNGLPPARNRGRNLVVITGYGTNGTFVNGQKLTGGSRLPLQTGDQIALASAPGYRHLPRMDYVWNVFIPRYDDQEEVSGAATPLEQQFTDRYPMLEELGNGSFATVFRCYDRQDGAPRAMKRIDKRRFATQRADQNVSNFRREINILRQVSHPNIVRYYDHIETSRYFFIVMELLDGGDFLEYIISHNGLPEQATQIIIAGLMQALAYLESMHTAHRDLKPENIMMTGGVHPIPKIVDFGLAKMLVDPEDRLTTQCGTPAYLAPEVLLGQLQNPSGGYSFSCDVYSLAVICYAALTNTSPFPEGEEAKNDLRRSCKTRRIDVDLMLVHRPDLSPHCCDFVRSISQHDPKKRLPAWQALLHPWIHGFTTSHPRSHSFASLPMNHSQDSSQPFSQPFQLTPRSAVAGPSAVHNPASADMNGRRSPAQRTDIDSSLQGWSGAQYPNALALARESLDTDPMNRTHGEPDEDSQPMTEDAFSQELRNMQIRTPADLSFSAMQVDGEGYQIRSTPARPDAAEARVATEVQPSPVPSVGGPSAPSSAVSDNELVDSHRRQPTEASTASSSRKRLTRHDTSSLTDLGAPSPAADATVAPPVTPGPSSDAAMPSSVATTASSTTTAANGPRRSKRLTGQPPEPQASLSSISTGRKAARRKAGTASPSHGATPTSRPRKTQRRA